VGSTCHRRREEVNVLEPTEAVEVGGVRGFIHVCGDERNVSVLINDGGGACMGFVSADELVFRRWRIGRIAVVDGSRGRGVGSFLIGRLKKEVERRPGFKRLEVFPADYGSDAARIKRFFGKNGFLAMCEGAPITGAYAWFALARDPRHCVRVWAEDEMEPPEGLMSNLKTAPTHWFDEAPDYAAELYALERWGNKPQEDRTVYVRTGKGELVTFKISSYVDVVVKVRKVS
jgi:GNAT superfamily N-acetyltransferase